MSSLIAQQTRLLNDLIAAERALRLNSEKHVRDLRQVLLNTAVRLDGKRLDALRRSDPQVTENWSIQQWEEFMKAIPPAHAWGISLPSQSAQELEDQRVRDLLSEIERQKRQIEVSAQKLFEVRKQHDQLQSEAQAAANIGHQGAALSALIPSTIVEGALAPWFFLLEDAKKIMKEVPKPCPPLQKAFVGGKRVGGDLQKAFARVYGALHLIGRHGLYATMEIDSLIGEASDASARSGSLRRIMDEMIEKELLLHATLELSSPRSVLKVVRLSQKGRQLYLDLFKTEPCENEWERLIRLHEGEKQIDHTFSVLWFAMHARKRSYYARVLPEVEGNAVPDLWIARGDQALHVEVELGSGEHETKWKNLAALNSGRVAICTAIPRMRERYMSDCQLAHEGGIASGVATDLETLVRYKYLEVNYATPLWVNEW